MSRRSYNKSIIFGLMLTGAVLACGPYFPNSYLTGDDEQLLAVPRLNFEKEIKRISSEQETTFRAVHRPAHIHNPRDHVLLIDVQDLQDALEKRGDSSDSIKTLVEEYRTVRRAVEQYKNECNHFYRSPSKGGHAGQEPVAKFSVDHISDGVPEEFRLYLQGAMSYWTRNIEKAVKKWEQLLALPEDQRYYRSTWAAYMISKCSASNKEKARFILGQVRQYARDGFADNLGLASISYGDEAGTYYRVNNYEKAIELYLTQASTGNLTSVPSLKQVCYGIFNRHKDLDMVRLVNNRMVREAMTAYAIAQGRCEKFNAFVSEVKQQKRIYTTSQQILLDAIEQAGLVDMKNADRFAAIAYGNGDYKRAHRWLDAADMNSLISRRIRAKLLLRDGDIKQAAEDLAFIARQTHSIGLHAYDDYTRLDNPKKLHSELGTLYVSQKMYIQAVDILMKGGNWYDAAYIAERVLTLEELQNYVDVNWPVSMLEPIDEDGFGPKGEKAMKIRYLLARRLSRHGQFEQARAYYPSTQKKLLEDFDAFTNALERANDSNRPQNECADAFWTAAWLMRHKGMEFMGTELSPDWTMFYGNYQLTDPMEYRKKFTSTKADSDTAVFEVASKPNTNNNQLNRPSPDEIERAANEAAIPNKRFHYRYFASDLAWEAAALMKNEDPELARRLCLAGIWHRDRDNEHADVFYKALVLRCGTTALGKEADEIKWFPKIPDTLKEEPPFKANTQTGEVNENTDA